MGFWLGLGSGFRVCGGGEVWSCKGAGQLLVSVQGGRLIAPPVKNTTTNQTKPTGWRVTLSCRV